MSITDELREWMRVVLTDDDPAHAIADRIDAEYQKAEDEWKANDGQTWLRGYAECHAELMEGNEVIAADLKKAGWVRGPLDADGEPWHVGDEIANEYNHHLTVSEIIYKGNGCWMLRAEPKWIFYADIARHHRPPTVEGILRDFGVDIAHALDADPDATVPESTIAEYAAKLRLRGDGE